MKIWNKYWRLGVLNNRNLFSHSCGGLNPRCRYWCGGHTWSSHSMCFWVQSSPFCKDIGLLFRDHPDDLILTQSPLKWPCLQIWSQSEVLGLWPQCMILEGHNSTHNSPLDIFKNFWFTPCLTSLSCDWFLPQWHGSARVCTERKKWDQALIFLMFACTCNITGVHFLYSF